MWLLVVTMLLSLTMVYLVLLLLEQALKILLAHSFRGWYCVGTGGILKGAEVVSDLLKSHVLHTTHEAYC